MRSIKSRSKRRKRRSRLQRGGGFLITKEQINNREYDFEMMNHNDKDYLVIKNTPYSLTDRIGLKITSAYKANDSGMGISKFTKVDDFKKFALEGESGIIIETDDSLQDEYKKILAQRKEDAEEEADVDALLRRIRAKPDIKITIIKNNPTDILGFTLKQDDDNNEIYVSKNYNLDETKQKNNSLSDRKINIGRITPGLFLKELKINSRKIELTSKQEVVDAIRDATGTLEFIFDGNRNYFKSSETISLGGKRKRKSKRKSRKRKTHRRKTRRH